jgi:hypothetical protein
VWESPKKTVVVVVQRGIDEFFVAIIADFAVLAQKID